MFIEFFPTRDAPSRVAVNSSAIRGVYLTDNCELYCVQIETEHDYLTYDVCKGDRKKCKAVFDRIADGLESQNYFVKVD